MAARSDPDSSCIEFAAQTAAALEALLSLIRHEFESIAPSKSLGADADSGDRSSPRSVVRGERLANDLQSFAARRPLSPAPVAPRPFLNDLAVLLRMMLERSIEIQVHVDDPCPLIWADPRALEHAMVSLVVNARDAMPEGGHLGLHAGPMELDDGERGVALAVSDTGTGMTADVAARAARPFFSTKANSPMAGLGLAAVDGFARQSGGAMRLHTANGKGTTVSLLLPAADQPE